ncbi:hypothetical protein DL93DRAFT_2083892 [Clavulina sp. PMI_390]|nr:hypothetical protein DL93DRAFT_2083892 [Clavulina sp. PMI_390]
MAQATARVRGPVGLLKRFWEKESWAARSAESRVAHYVVPSSSPAGAVARENIPNPFIPTLNPLTGKWRPARYSRRRQAELVKAARLLSAETLLPLGPKGQRKLGATPPPNATEVPQPLLQTIAENPVKWSGEPPALTEKSPYSGRRFMFKGHKWERQLPAREQSFHDFTTTHDLKKTKMERRDRQWANRAEQRKRQGDLLS